MERKRRHILIVPVLVWAGLMALLFASLGYAYLPDAPLKIAFGIAVAVGKAALIGVVFMQLTKASALVRVTAAAGAAWLSLLFLFSFADFLTR